MPKKTYHQPQKNQQTQQVIKNYNCDHEVKKFQTIMQNFMKDNVRTFGKTANVRHTQPTMGEMLTIGQRPCIETQKKQPVSDHYKTSNSFYGTNVYKNQRMVERKLTREEFEKQLRQKICAGEYLLDDLPQNYLTKYFDDTALQCIESYEELIRAMARTKNGRKLLQSILGKKGQTLDGKSMTIGEDFKVTLDNFDVLCDKLASMAGYNDILEGLRYTEEGQELLKEFGQKRLTENKGILNYDKIIAIISRLYPTKEELIGLIKSYSNRDYLIEVLLYYVTELYKEGCDKPSSHTESEKSCNWNKVNDRLHAIRKIGISQDPEKVKRRKARIKKFMETTRWLPNTSFQTYFGKPAWCQYGHGNKQPTAGGIIYGQYMQTHNINPHRFPNNPKHQEVFKATDNKYDALEAQGRIRAQEPPRKCKAEFAQSQHQINKLMNRAQMTSTLREGDLKNIENTDLLNTHRFASNSDSPLRNDKHCWTDCEKKRLETARNLQKLSETSRRLRLKNAIDKEQEERQFYKKNINKTIEAKSKKDKKKHKKSKKKKDKKKKKSSMKSTLKCKEDQEKEWRSKYQVDYNDEKDNKSTHRLRIKIPSDLHETVRYELDSKEDKYVKEKYVDTVDYQVKEKLKKAKKAIEKETSEKESTQEADPHCKEAREKVTITEDFIKNLKAQIAKERGEGEKPDVFDVATDQEKIMRNLFNQQHVSPLKKQGVRTKTQEYFNSLSTMELNPKNYQNIPSVWLNRIPYAGRVSDEHQNIRDNFIFSHLC